MIPSTVLATKKGSIPISRIRVTGQRSLDGVFGRLSIPNFTDEHDVRVMPKDASQRGSKGQTDLGVNLDLVDPIELVLDWVLGRDDLVL